MAEESPSLKALATASEEPGMDNKPQSHPPRRSDEEVLARLGKRQQFRRNFGLVSIIALTATLMETWEGNVSGYSAAFPNGGPAGMIYAFIVAIFGAFSQALVMAEMASMVPLSGGQYNWVAVLAPPSCSKFLSYMTGWMTIIGWQAGTVATAFTGAAMISALAMENHADYVSEPWKIVLMSWAATCVAVFVNTCLGVVLPAIETMIFLVHTLGFLAVLIPVVYFAPHGAASEVFGYFVNAGGWQTQGLSFMVGLPYAMVSFIGIDGAAHMAEEIANSQMVVPRSMLMAVGINAVLGMAMLIAVMFCIGDIDAVLSTPTGFPIIAIFSQALRSSGGTAALTAILIASNIFSSIGLMAGSSRMLWAFAREKAVPGYQLLSRVEARTKLPLYSIGMTAIISGLLVLIELGSTVVLGAFLSLTTAGIYSATLISSCVMLHKRLTVLDSKISWGPFRMGRWGIPVNVFTCLYTFMGIFWSFWPPERQVKLSNMNWNVVIYVGAVVLSLLFWLSWGRRVYKGPILEVTLRH